MRRCVRCKILGASRLLEGRIVASDVQGMIAALNLEGTLAQLAVRGREANPHGPEAGGTINLETGQ